MIVKNLKLVFTGCGDGVARAYDAKSATLRRVYQVRIQICYKFKSL